VRFSSCALLCLPTVVAAGCVGDQGGLELRADAAVGPGGPTRAQPITAEADAAVAPTELGPRPVTSVPITPTSRDWPQKGCWAGNGAATPQPIPDSPVVQWQATLPGDAAYNAPVVGNGRIYFLLYGGGVAALDLATGNLLWQNTQVWGAKNHAPTYAEERLFVPTENPSSVGGKDPTAGTIVALDAATGELLWRGNQAGTAIREVAGDIYFTGPAGEVHCLDGASGGERWTASLNCGEGLALDGDSGFCLYSDLVGFDRRTGQKRFAVSRGVGFSFSELAVASGFVYYQSDEMLYARSGSDGRILWSVPVGFSPVTNGIVETSPAVYGGRVFVATQSTLMAFTIDGIELWSATPPPNRNPGSVELAGNRLLLGGSAIYDADSGRALWTAPAGMPVLSRPPIADGRFYTHEGPTVYAWGASP